MIRDLTPMLAVADIGAACRFMETCLGFETKMQTPDHGYCSRDGGAIRFVNAAPDADMDDPARQVVVYLDCDDVDAFWAAHAAAIDALPPTHRRAPFDRPYGQREFHLIHGPFLFMVGHPIPKEATP